MKKIFFSVLYYLFLLRPVLAAEEITGGGGPVGFLWKGTGKGGKTCNVAGPCDFCDALIVTKNAITFLFEIAVPITVAMIAYGAIRMMIAAGNEEQVKNARQIMTSAVVGLVIVLAAWIIVNTILHLLAKDPTVAVWNEITCTR